LGVGIASTGSLTGQGLMMPVVDDNFCILLVENKTLKK